MVWMIGAGSLLGVVLIVAGLVSLARIRHTMGLPQFVLWVAIIVLLPFAGLIAYLFWRIARAESIQDAARYADEQPNRPDPESRPRY